MHTINRNFGAYNNIEPGNPERYPSGATRNGRILTQVALGVTGVEELTVKRRLILALELARLKLLLDFLRPPRRGPEGGRPVERLSSFRKESPHD